MLCSSGKIPLSTPLLFFCPLSCSLTTLYLFIYILSLPLILALNPCGTNKYWGILSWCHLQCTCSYPWAMLTLRAMYGSMVLLQSGAILISVTYVATKGLLDVCGLFCHVKPYWWFFCYCAPCWCKGLMLPCRCHINVHGPCCQQGPCWCQWSVLPLRAIMVSMAYATLMYMVYAASGHHVEVHGTWWYWIQCRCLRSTLSPKTMWKFIICAPADSK